MLIPRFSIRWILAFTAACGIVLLFARAAWNGQYWSGAVVIGIIFLLLTLLVHGAAFGLLWIVSRIFAAVFRDTRKAAAATEAGPPLTHGDAP